MEDRAIIEKGSIECRKEGGINRDKEDQLFALLALMMPIRFPPALCGSSDPGPTR